MSTIDLLYLQAASEAFCIEPFPDDWESMSEEEQNEWLDENKTSQFEYMDNYRLSSMIHDHADSIKNTLSPQATETKTKKPEVSILEQEFIASHLQGHQLDDFIPLTWDYIESFPVTSSGKVASFICDDDFNSYDTIEDAANAGAIKFGNKHILSKEQLEGLMIGAELSQETTGVKTRLFFIPDARPSVSKHVALPSIQVMHLQDSELKGDDQYTQTTLHLEDHGITIGFDGFSDYSSYDNFGSPIYIERTCGDIILYVFADINTESPTHTISLSQARNQKRIEE